MSINIAINGFGRIGRLIFRSIFEEKYNDIEIKAINGPADIDTHIFLLQYDSVHGRFPYEVKKIDDNHFMVDNQKIRLFRERDPSKINWKEYDINIVMESTGKFTKYEDLNKHIISGAKKTILSAPAKDNLVKTIIYGVNDNIIDNNDKIISIGSCTTNAAAPLIKILEDKFEIKKAFLNTIHSYTNDQNIVDNSHKDLRRARSAALSMIPTSTGAAKALTILFPNLTNKIDGVAIRVPTANVSLVELTLVIDKNSNIEEINNLFLESIKSNDKLGKSVEYVNEKLVSIDFNHSKYSSCFDSTQTKVIDGNLVKISAWYDNEYSFAIRMLDIARIMI